MKTAPKPYPKFEIESNELALPGAEHCRLLNVSYDFDRDGAFAEFIECADTGKSFELKELPAEDQRRIADRLEQLTQDRIDDGNEARAEAMKYER